MSCHAEEVMLLVVSTLVEVNATFKKDDYDVEWDHNEWKEKRMPQGTNNISMAFDTACCIYHASGNPYYTSQPVTASTTGD